MICLSVVCGGIAGLGFLDPTASLGIKLGLAIPFGLMVFFFLFLAFRPAEKHPAIVALRDFSDQIVWIYPSRMIVNGRHSQTFIYLGMSSGKRRGLPIGKETDPDPLIERLARAIPHARRGYSNELDAQFKKAPSSLIAA